MIQSDFNSPERSEPVRFSVVSFRRLLKPSMTPLETVFLAELS